MSATKLTKPQRGALALLKAEGGGIASDDERTNPFSDDEQPTDTWNHLFNAGLAEQWGPGWSGDDFSLHITDAGRRALSEGGE